MSTTPTHTIRALASTLPESDELPLEIQYMPPGKHTITATRDGEPFEITLEVGEKAADNLSESLALLREAGQDPYLDFNHDDQEASAWVKAFHWGGDDAVTGGVRATVEWTEAGREAVAGRGYRKFSPTFVVNDVGEITGTTPNAGGLVNRPAFTAIAPIVAKDLNDPQTQTPTQQIPMTETPTHEQLIAELRAKLDAATGELNQIKAAQAAAETARIEAQAKADVDAAVAEGRIAAKDAAVWQSAILASANTVDLLRGLPKPSAASLESIIAGKQPETLELGEAKGTLTEYNAILCPRERAAFYAKHRAVILAS